MHYAHHFIQRLGPLELLSPSMEIVKYCKAPTIRRIDGSINGEPTDLGSIGLVTIGKERGL